MALEPYPQPTPRTSRVKTNFIANLAGSGWTALAGLICTPLYIKFMGMEAYGLVGFYLMLQGVIQILDLGLSPTMNREMARYSTLPVKAGEARDFVRTLEIGYWAIGGLIGVTIYYAAPFIATNWIKAGSLPVAEIRRAVTIMGALAALQWPLSLYQGGLLGLQRHTMLNGIAIAMSTLAGGGAVLILWLLSPTLTAFFTWQIGVSLLQVSLTTIALWHSLPPADRSARVVPSLLRGVGVFAAGMSGITLTSLILTQLDKVILSKLFDLKTFGYYVLAGVVGNGLTVLITPMFNTVFPRFSELVAEKNDTALLQMYHGSTQVMAVLILPIAAVIAFFSYEIVALWTGSAEIAAHVAPLARILVIGTAINGLMNLPFALQLAHGWTRIGLTINIFFIFCLVPSIYYLATHYGTVGAASAWVLLNAFYMVIGVPLTHRRLLKGEALRWFTQDICLPLAGAVLVAGIGRKLIGGSMRPLITGALLSSVWACAITVTTLATPASRSWIVRRIYSL